MASSACQILELHSDDLCDHRELLIFFGFADPERSPFQFQFLRIWQLKNFSMAAESECCDLEATNTQFRPRRTGEISHRCEAVRDVVQQLILARISSNSLAVLTPWSLPLYWHLRRLRLAVELDCDNRVVQRLGDAPAYASLLLRIATGPHRRSRLEPAFLGGGGSLERRLRHLVAPAARSHVAHLLLAGMAVTVALLVLGMPHPVAAKDHPAPNAVHRGSVRVAGR